MVIMNKFSVTLLQGENQVEICLGGYDLPDLLRILCISKVNFEISTL